MVLKKIVFQEGVLVPDWATPVFLLHCETWVIVLVAHDYSLHCSETVAPQYLFKYGVPIPEMEWEGDDVGSGMMWFGSNGRLGLVGLRSILINRHLVPTRMARVMERPAHYHKGATSSDVGAYSVE